jgi:aryl-alcohol dehydrogenase-like predicted oxidoreductase
MPLEHGTFPARQPSLGLGTVQFGMDYGVSNRRGRPSLFEVKAILRAAGDKGIRILDTAAAYGDAEDSIGDSGEADRFAIVTKTLPLRLCASDKKPIDAVREAFLESLTRLRTESVDTLLVHDANDLLGPYGNQIYEQLQDYRRNGLVRRIGVSAYAGEEIDAALDRYVLDVVQVPANVFDQRLQRHGQLERLAALGVEVHLRSAFLQGLLLMEPGQLQPYFAPLRTRLEAWHKRLAREGWTPAQGALAFVRTLKVGVVLVGVESVEQLQANVRDFSVPLPQPMDFAEFAVDDEDFVNPSRWKI